MEDTNPYYEPSENGTPLWPTDNGSTPLWQACYRCHEEIVKMLLAAGADPNIPNARRQTPLWVATYGGFHEIVELLLSSPQITMDINTKAICGRTPIQCAQHWHQQEQEKNRESWAARGQQRTVTHLVTDYSRTIDVILRQIKKTRVDIAKLFYNKKEFPTDIIRYICTYIN